MHRLRRVGSFGLSEVLEEFLEDAAFLGLFSFLIPLSLFSKVETILSGLGFLDPSGISGVERHSRRHSPIVCRSDAVSLNLLPSTSS